MDVSDMTFVVEQRSTGMHDGPNPNPSPNPSPGPNPTPTPTPSPYPSPNPNPTLRRARRNGLGRT